MVFIFSTASRTDIVYLQNTRVYGQLQPQKCKVGQKKRIYQIQCSKFTRGMSQFGLSHLFIMKYPSQDEISFTPFK